MNTSQRRRARFYGRGHGDHDGERLPPDEHPELAQDDGEPSRAAVDVVAEAAEVGRTDAPRGRGRPPVRVVLAQHDELIGALRDVAARVSRAAPNVIATTTYQLDGNGMATRSFRVPFAAVAVTSASLNPLTIVSGSGSGTAAPGPGDGAGQVPVLGFAAHNLTGYQWTIYGGNPGDQVTVSTFGRPVPPVAESGVVSVTGTVAAGAFGQPSIANTGTSTAPAAGSTIVTTGALGVGLYQVDWMLSLAGTVAAGDGNNMQLLQGATNISGGSLIPAVATAPPVQQLRILSRIASGTAAFRVTAIAAGGASAIYGAQVSATRVG